MQITKMQSKSATASLNLHRVTLDDKPLFDKYIEEGEEQNCDLNFANIYRNITGEHPFDDVDYLKKGLRFIINSWFPSDNEKKDYYIGFGDCEQPHCSLNSPLSLIRYGIDDVVVLYSHKYSAS